MHSTLNGRVAALSLDDMRARKEKHESRLFNGEPRRAKGACHCMQRGCTRYMPCPCSHG